MLENMNRVLQDARAKGYGIPAPGVNDFQTIEAVFQACSELKSPLIIDCVPRNDIEAVADMTKFVAKRFPHVPAALNLDHGTTFDVCAKAIQAGFTSVMIDCSKLPFEENVRITAEVVKMAHAVGVSVEAELGHLGTGQEIGDDHRDTFTKPHEAVEFVEKTSVDCLAVAVGTAHGFYKGDAPRIDLELISELKKALPIPLVLHGGSSAGDDQLANAVKAGISKINLFSDLSSAGTEAVKGFLAQGKTTVLGFMPLSMVYSVGVEAYKKMFMHYIEVFGSANQI
jgi:fructose-bisphosphate aldolase class II